MNQIQALIDKVKAGYTAADVLEATTAAGVAANVTRPLGVNDDHEDDEGYNNGLQKLKDLAKDKRFQEATLSDAEKKELNTIRDQIGKTRDRVDKAIKDSESQATIQFLWIVRTDLTLHYDNLPKIISSAAGEYGKSKYWKS